MLDLLAVIKLGKKMAVSQYTNIEADAFLRGYIVAMTQVIANGKSLDDCARLPAEAAKIIKSAQQKIQPTNGGQSASDELSQPATISG